MQVKRIVDAPAEVATGCAIADHFGVFRCGQHDQFEVRQDHLLNDQPYLVGVERCFKRGSSQNRIEFGQGMSTRESPVVLNEELFEDESGGRVVGMICDRGSDKTEVSKNQIIGPRTFARARCGRH